MNNQNGPLIVVAATSDPVTLAQAKAYCQVTGDADDALLSSLIPAATDYVQRLMGLQLISATIKQTWDTFRVGKVYENGLWRGSVCGGSELLLDRSPVSSVGSVAYYDVGGTLRSIGVSYWWADIHARPPRVLPAVSYTWPEVQDGRPAAVEVTYVAGYSSVSLIPPGILVAVKAVIKHWYDNRGPALTTGAVPQPVPHSLDALIQLHSRSGYG